MMRLMAEKQPSLRLSESWPGRAAGWLLAALWIFSMSGVDAHAFSAFPACVVLGVVLLLAIGAMLAGKRLVRMSALGWFSLAAGGYFLLRCLHSYSVVDSWAEAPRILGAFVYYVAGVYAAQNKNPGRIVGVLSAALLLNMLAMWAVRQPWFCLEWTGRAAFTPEGANSLPTSLFIYKNFAGVFFCVGGCVLGAWAWWMQRGVPRAACLLVAAGAFLSSLMCGTRAVYLVLPLSLVVLWFIRVLHRVFHDQRIGAANVALGICLFAGILIAVADFLFGHQLAVVVTGVDSHLRFLIWAAVCEVLPDAPLWGYGAQAATWELVPYYNEWQLPNYVHNEYLQTWADYGLLGLALVLLVLLLHVVQGVRCLIAEGGSPTRQYLAGGALLVLVAVAVYAMADFPWHSFALVAMCAFCCGVLASPYASRQQPWFSRRQWQDAGQAPMVAVRAQKWPGRALLVLLSVVLLALSAWLGRALQPAWSAQWKYNELSCGSGDGSAMERRALIAELLPLYPSPALMDTYFLFPQNGVSPAERERLLRIALAANPRQLFTLTMLVDTLGAQNKYAEAEQLMREHFVGDAMPGTMLCNWPSYYAYNLLLWGRFEMQQGNHGRALSLLDYALSMHARNYISFGVPHRGGEQPWKQHGGVKPGCHKLIETARADLRLLRLIGTQADDSWMLPMTPGGRSALYRSLVKKMR